MSESWTLPELAWEILQTLFPTKQLQLEKLWKQKPPSFNVSENYECPKGT